MTTVPLQTTQTRIAALDVLRGFALFGILLVNMLDFSGSALRAGTLGMRGGELDQIVDIGITFFAVTKFYLLFSLLFGIGFAVQMRRMESSGRPFVGFYARRLLILLVIGFAHSILIWDGDILRLYAVAGVLLIAVRHLPTRVVLGLALFIAAAGLIFFGLASGLEEVSEMTGTQALDIYTQGSYPDLVRARASQPIIPDIQTPMVLVMFLLGLVVGRSGVLDHPERYQPFLRRWWKPLLVVGLVGNALMLIGYSEANMPLISLGVHVGAPALSFVYLSAVLLNAERLSWLAPAGQMALTNYLAQALIGTTLFYGYGFGLYDQLAPTVTFLLVFVIFGVQVVVSAGWMKRFRYGPMEWLWRSLTHGKAQPMGQMPVSAASRRRDKVMEG